MISVIIGYHLDDDEKKLYMWENCTGDFIYNGTFEDNLKKYYAVVETFKGLQVVRVVGCGTVTDGVTRKAYKFFNMEIEDGTNKD